MKSTAFNFDIEVIKQELKNTIGLSETTGVKSYLSWSKYF